MKKRNIEKIIGFGETLFMGGTAYAGMYLMQENYHTLTITPNMTDHIKLFYGIGLLTELGIIGLSSFGIVDGISSIIKSSPFYLTKKTLTKIEEIRNKIEEEDQD